MKIKTLYLIILLLTLFSCNSYQYSVLWKKEMKGSLILACYSRQSEHIAIIENVFTDKEKNKLSNSIIKCYDKDGNSLWNYSQSNIQFRNIRWGKQSNILFADAYNYLNKSQKVILFDEHGEIIDNYDDISISEISQDDNFILEYDVDVSNFSLYDIKRRKEIPDFWSKISNNISIEEVLFIPFSNDIIFSMANGWFYCVSIDGKVNWNKIIGKGVYYNGIKISEDGNKILIITEIKTKEGNHSGIKLTYMDKNGKINWEKEYLDTYENEVAISKYGEYVVYKNNKTIFVYKRNGEEIFKYTIKEQYENCRILMINETKKEVIISIKTKRKSRLYCISFIKNKELWSISIGRYYSFIPIDDLGRFIMINNSIGIYKIKY